MLKRLELLLDTNALEQAQFLDRFDPKYVDLAILIAATLNLFLELAIIRWQSSVLEFFAFYKNFSLLACFVGLGLGYALATRTRIPLLLAIPLLAWQFGFMIIVRFGLGHEEALRTLPFREQLNMGIDIGPAGAFMQKPTVLHNALSSDQLYGYRMKRANITNVHLTACSGAILSRKSPRKPVQLIKMRCMEPPKFSGRTKP